MQKIFIIGAGYAGRRAALRLREYGDVTVIDERDVLLNREVFWSWLGKRAETKELILMPEKWCNAHKTSFIHAKVDKLYPLKKEIGLSTKERYTYDILIVASGSLSPRKQDVVGESKQGVWYLGQGDPKIFSQLLQDANYVVVEAATYAGATAAVLIKRTMPHKEIKVFATRDAVADLLLRHFSEEQIEVFREELTECIGEGGVRAVRVKNSKVFAADLVIMDTGLVPHTKVFETLGFFQLHDDAFVVDASQQTKVEGIYAIGDATLAHSCNDAGFFTATQRIDQQIERLVKHVSREAVEQEPLVFSAVSQEDMVRFVKEYTSVPPAA